MSQLEHPENRDFDIVVWGATGFTGRLVVEYLAGKYPPDGEIRWAVAGRSRDKLEAVLADLHWSGKKPNVILGDSADPASLDALAGRTRVVLTTVGPYANYGSALVEACIANGTDYCDLCGEVQWMRKMIDRHQAAAAQSGARVVMSCGFDSIPSDLGVHCLQQHAKESFGAPVSKVHLLVRAMRGGASGGTFASMLNAVIEARSDSDVARVLAEPYALNPAGQRNGPDGSDQNGARFDKLARVWTAPFVMARVNTRVVRRTNALLDYTYGDDFRYSEATITGNGIRGRLKAILGGWLLGAFVLASAFEFTRENIVRRFLPAPGEGPSREQRENGFFNLLLIGLTADGSQLRLRVKGDRDPGYGSTSKMLAESAISLAIGDCHRDGGFWTPASAMGDRLRARLEAHAGLSFEFE